MNTREYDLLREAAIVNVVRPILQKFFFQIGWAGQPRPGKYARARQVAKQRLKERSPARCVCCKISYEIRRADRLPSRRLRWCIYGREKKMMSID